MDIDLSLLHSQNIEEIDLTATYNMPKSYFKNSGVLDIKDLKLEGNLYLEYSEDNSEKLIDYAKVAIKAILVLEDSISLEPVEYPIAIEYDDILEENCKKNENTLDIFQFLWENIVLEIPLQFTKVQDLSKFHGDGWKLISEDELKTSNNPFNDLLKDFKEE